MKTVSERPSFQGGVMLRRIAKMPEGEFVEVKPQNGRLIVEHSETGHHHVIENSRAAQLLINKTNALFGVLKVAEACELRHLRNFDTHGPFMLERGLYEVRHKREFGPEGWRRDIE